MHYGLKAGVDYKRENKPNICIDPIITKELTSSSDPVAYISKFICLQQIAVAFKCNLPVKQ